MRRIEDQTHETTTNGASDGNSHDPSKQQKTDTLEVDSLKRSVAQTDTDGGTSNAHRGGDGQGVLGEDQDGNGSAHLHGGSTGR